ncbi:MAG: VirK/YbjX family protein [Poseidonibacter sp.]|uniref:VirK/YbjX family protein n=1 Tax=Poseidonibacter sp. TaxID=2321188 RepID=UPI00359E1E5C
MSKSQISLLQIAKELNGSNFKKFKFILRGLLHKNDIKSLYHLFLNSNLEPVIKSQPDIYNKPFRAYLFCNNAIKNKFEHIQSHYSYISNNFTSNAIEKIYSTFELDLLEFELENIGKIKVKLCYIAALGKEGEMTLLLDLNNEDLYSISFSFYQKDNDLEFIIYGIQSRSSVNPDTIKQVTKKMHGVRPRNYLFFILRQICEVYNVNKISAIRSQFHVANCSHVSKTDKFQANYDQYWEEESGIAGDKFYTLPLVEKRKTMEEIASKKRSMYNKRYNMLDEHKEVMKKVLKSLQN